MFSLWSQLSCLSKVGARLTRCLTLEFNLCSMSEVTPKDAMFDAAAAASKTGTVAPAAVVATTGDGVAPDAAVATTGAVAPDALVEVKIEDPDAAVDPDTEPDALSLLNAENGESEPPTDDGDLSEPPTLDSDENL